MFLFLAIFQMKGIGDENTFKSGITLHASFTNTKWPRDNNYTIF
jgi:hypothetical protein